MTCSRGQRSGLEFLIALLIAATLLSSCTPLAVIEGPLAFSQGEDDTARARVCDRPTIEALAQDLDSLERHIETYGSVVTKQPDVWGQARLTKYRDEYEQQMAAELGNFAFTLQGSVSGSDQAYFADAFALSAAASSSAATIRRGASKSGSAASTSTTTTTIIPGTLTKPSEIVQTEPGPAPAPSPGAPSIAIPPAPAPTGTFAAFNNITRDPTTMPPPLGFNGAKGGITLEPTLYLDQKSVYLNHLHELRRISEGDDTADSPGYSLNLVRIPVSVLPGKRTEIGYGAEVTMTLEPYLNDELLPTTFRNLVINDLVDQIAFPATQFINDPDKRVYLDPSATDEMSHLFNFLEEYSFSDMIQPDHLKQLKELRASPSLKSLFARPEWAWVDRLLSLVEPPAPAPPVPPLPQPSAQQIGTQQLIAYQTTAQQPGAIAPQPGAPQTAATQPAATQPVPLQPVGPQSVDPRNCDVDAATLSAREQAKRRIMSDIARLKFQLHGPALVPSSKSRRARLPFPPSELLNVYGYDFTFHLAADTFSALANQAFSHPSTESTAIYIHLPDVQGFLQEELAAAYDLLNHPIGLPLWSFCSPETGLVAAIRSRNEHRIWQIRSDFKRQIEAIQSAGSPDCDPSFKHSTAAALAWAVVVEAALLDDQLRQDMRESAQLKGCPIAEPLPPDFYSPRPSTEALQAFNQYVRCRWPMHVFALDPAAWEQNIASTFSMRREMQLALALAFMNGRVSTSNMMQFARRIEFDFATVDLNGTAVGFSHGDDTFGWRFYPRFQTPDVPSNLQACAQDVLCGGPTKDQLLKQRRLEPGIRECYAVVIMPSFVPYATLNVSANWFSLINPRKKEFDTQYAVKLSSSVKSIESCAPCVIDAPAYRDGELERLIERARQLETRLPMQTTQVQVPYENTLGGFALFSTGVTDLAPELVGWYGTSSINPAANTTLFLVGNHFSTHQTVVIAGGQIITQQQLLSRQVMEVTIPQNPLLVGDASEKFVDVHVATPYGVTQHLLIPAVIPPPIGPPGAPIGTPSQSIAWNPPQLSIAYTYGGTGIVAPSGGGATASSAAGPSAAGPSATGPSATGPAAGGPPGTGPAGTGPATPASGVNGTAGSGTNPAGSAPSASSSAGAPNAKPASLLIQHGDVDGTKYDVVDVTLQFDPKYGINPPTNAIALPTASYDATRGGYVISTGPVAAEIVAAFSRVFGPDGTNSPQPLSTITKLVFRCSTKPYPDITTKTTANSLSIQWIQAATASANSGGSGRSGNSASGGSGSGTGPASSPVASSATASSPGVSGSTASPAGNVIGAGSGSTPESGSNSTTSAGKSGAAGHAGGRKKTAATGGTSDLSGTAAGGNIPSASAASVTGS